MQGHPIKNPALYDWIEVYQKIADRLLDFKTDRISLISLIKEAFSKVNIKLPTLERKGTDLYDICPFTFFGLFNKNLTDKNRKTIVQSLLRGLNIPLSCPESFAGIPVLNPQMATFYWFDGQRGEQDINNLWDIFEAAIKHADTPTPDTKERFIHLYNTCQQQKGVKWNLSMGFYWIRPNCYLSLDQKNRWYLESSGEFSDELAIKTREKRTSVPDALEYLQITADTLEQITENNAPYSNFAEFSYHAWLVSEEVNKKTKEDAKKKAHYAWVPVYQNLADRLLGFKSNRKALIDIIKQAFEAADLKVPTLAPEDEELIDICPFTFFGTFNKKLQAETRTKILNNLLQLLDLPGSAPTSFDGIPILNPQNATYYWISEKKRGIHDIDNLWDLYAAALHYADKPSEDTRKQFTVLFDTCQQQTWVKWNLTQGLFWVRPYHYISLDSINKRYIETSGDFSSELVAQVKGSKETVPAGEEYLKMVETLQQQITSNNAPYSDFVEFSHHTWKVAKTEQSSEMTKEIKILTIKDGQYQVDIDISIDEWKEMLLDETIFYSDALRAVLEWYSRPGHQASSKEVMRDTHPNHKGSPYNGIIASLGKRIVAHLNRFEIKREDDSGNVYWCIPFEGWQGSNGQLVWKVRDELATAIEELRLADSANADCIVAEEVVETHEGYTAEQFLEEVYLSPQDYADLKGKLLHKKNIILQGAPGVGKTFSAKRLAWSIMGCKDESRVKMVQFHQSYGYEDFIMGYRPCCDGGFELKCGPFYAFCKQAARDINRDYFFIIDEINRGNLSKIFGELFMLMENEHRGESLTLLYNGEDFTIPGNVHIIGMMNTADRSLAMLDYALRRRFAFFELHPAFQSSGFIRYQQQHSNARFDNLISTIIRLNEEIAQDESLGRGFRIGHSYFCTGRNLTDSWLKSVVSYEIIPLLEEYWFDSPDKIDNWKLILQGCIQ